VKAYLKDIDALGGTLKAIESGWIQNEIQNAAYEYQREIESGKRIVVGVNKFRAKDEKPIATFRLDPELERTQLESVRKVKATRDNAATSSALSRLRQAASDGSNLMPHILSAAENYATVGEISDELRSVFGEYRESGY
jgi:methylmalonyl-CoA mutase N-terminal domain/subunit